MGSFSNEVHTIEPNGKAPEAADQEGSNSDPSYSPNGKRIVFTSDRDGDTEIFKMHANGTRERRLTKNDDVDFNPAWSPDGRRFPSPATPAAAATSTR